MYHLNHNRNIIGLLLKSKELEKEYPSRLLVERRASFVALVMRCSRVSAQSYSKTPSTWEVLIHADQ